MLKLVLLLLALLFAVNVYADVVYTATFTVNQETTAPSGLPNVTATVQQLDKLIVLLNIGYTNHEIIMYPGYRYLLR